MKKEIAKLKLAVLQRIAAQLCENGFISHENYEAIITAITPKQ